MSISETDDLFKLKGWIDCGVVNAESEIPVLTIESDITSGYDPETGEKIFECGTDYLLRQCLDFLEISYDEA